METVAVEVAPTSSTEEDPTQNALFVHDETEEFEIIEISIDGMCGVY